MLTVYQCRMSKSMQSTYAGFVWPNDQTVLLFVNSVVLGSHSEIVEGEVECVDDLEKVQRGVEDRVQTTASAKET